MAASPDEPGAAVDVDPDVTDFLAALEYTLPEDLIARHPPAERDGARMLQVTADALTDRRVVELPSLLREGDLLVVNDTAVVPARLHGRRKTGGKVELLVLPTTRRGEQLQAMLRPARRLSVGERLELDGGGEACLVDREAPGSESEGLWWVRLAPDVDTVLASSGHVPLPPYLRRPDQPEDRNRYQTVYAGPPGAVAAPTAGLHLSHRLLDALAERGVQRASVTLHVGPGTFRPLRPADVARGRLHTEPWTLPQQTADAVDACRARGGRVVAIGTTSTRVLESAALPGGRVRAGSGVTDLFLRPGQSFAVVDRLLTNLHLPGSSLLALVQAFAGTERVAAAYRHAVAASYRFYSYGDAMLLDLAPPRPGDAGPRP